MILSDRSINEAIASGRLGIDPFDPKLVQPSSIDVRLDKKFLVFRNTKRAFIDVKQPADDLMEMIEVGANDPMFLHPHEFVLGSTVERVRMPDDLVARLEGRSSLGRLGVVIHSSLPYDSPVLFLGDDDGDVLEQRPIGEIVERRLPGRVVGFDRDTFAVGFYEVTSWFRELPDKIYEVRLASGRRVHVTAGHNLFTLDPSGELMKTPTGSLRSGTAVATPKWLPAPSDATPVYRTLDLVSDQVKRQLLCMGPTVDVAFEAFQSEVRRLLREAGLSVSYYVHRRVLPVWVLLRLSGNSPPFGALDRFRHRGSPVSIPALIRVERELAWLLGLYVAQGYRSDNEIFIANTEHAILNRAERAFDLLGLRVRRSRGAVTCCSRLVSAVFEGLEMGQDAASKRLPRGALGWPWELLEALQEGLVDGDSSTTPTPSSALQSDVLLIRTRLVRRGIAQGDARRADRRRSAENNMEVGRDRSAVHVATLEWIHDSYSRFVSSIFDPIGKLTRLVNGSLQWDKVVEVVDTGRFESVYDLEVRSPTARVENFLAGFGGVFVSNTAGFIDPSFDGHVTLEISNLANLPIALYPGMRIGQLSFSLMTTPSERPYGPARGSKYSGQDVPTASRLYLDFQQ